MQTYEFWQAALENKQNSIPLDVNTPLPGFYKAKKHKDAPWHPVAIWYEGDDCIATDHKGSIDVSKAWPWCAKYPITEEDFRYFETNGRWQGEVTIGDNNPPSDIESLKHQIDEVIATAEQWLDGRTITTTADADKAAGFQQKLSALSKQADNERKEKKRPIIDAGKEIEATYKPLIEEPKGTIAKLKSSITVFLRAEQKKADEKARQEQIEAAKKIAEAEKIKDDEEKKNLTAREEKIIKEAEVAVAAPVQKAKVSAGSNTGRKVTLRKVTRGQIEDYEKLLLALKDREEIKTLVQTLANRAAKSGVELDGMKIIEEQVV